MTVSFHIDVDFIFPKELLSEFISAHSTPAAPSVKTAGREVSLQFFRAIPKKPGVYLMRDAEDRLLYIGKSVIRQSAE